MRESRGEVRTSKEVIAREVVGPDGHEDHGDGKDGELCHDAAVLFKAHDVEQLRQRLGYGSSEEVRCRLVVVVAQGKRLTHERSAWPSGEASAARRWSGTRGRGTPRPNMVPRLTRFAEGLFRCRTEADGAGDPGSSVVCSVYDYGDTRELTSADQSARARSQALEFRGRRTRLLSSPDHERELQ